MTVSNFKEQEKRRKGENRRKGIQERKYYLLVNQCPGWRLGKKMREKLPRKVEICDGDERYS